MPFTAVLPSADMRIDGPPYPLSKSPNRREKLTYLSNWLNLGSQCRDTSVVRLTQGVIVRRLVAISCYKFLATAQLTEPSSKQRFTQF